MTKSAGVTSEKTRTHRCACGGIPDTTGECAKCRARRLAAHGTAPGSPSPGHRDGLPETLRRQMEARFGTSFADVRVRADDAAGREALELGAEAFTRGSDIVFAPGAYRPSQADGQMLIAHELTHVAQQRLGQFPLSPGALRPAAARSRLEDEANRVAATIGATTDAPAVREPAAEPALHRSPGPLDELRERLSGGLEPAVEWALELPGVRSIPGVSTAVALRDEVRGVGSLRFDAQTAAEIEAALARLHAAAPSWLPVPELSFRGPEVQQQGPLVIPELLILLAILFLILVLIIMYLQRLARGGTMPTPSDVDEVREKIRRALRAPKAEPKPEPEPEPEKGPKRPPLGPDIFEDDCREPWDPCPNTLSVSWPAILPLPEDVTLQRTPADVREAEGIDRGAAQRELAERIREAREEGSPPPEPCFPEDVDPNEFYDAHHIHPIYLGGVDEPTNLCALDRDSHRAGHPLLDDQTEHFHEYRACKVCSPFLTEHPQLQEYAIVDRK